MFRVGFRIGFDFNGRIQVFTIGFKIIAVGFLGLRV